MKELLQLPNIGGNIAEKLYQAGIESKNDLIYKGSEKAFTAIKTIDKSACINMLYAIEGAVQGIRWHDLSNERKEELKQFFAVLEKANK